MLEATNLFEHRFRKCKGVEQLQASISAHVITYCGWWCALCAFVAGDTHTASHSPFLCEPAQCSPIFSRFLQSERLSTVHVFFVRLLQLHQANAFHLIFFLSPNASVSCVALFFLTQCGYSNTKSWVASTHQITHIHSGGWVKQKIVA